MWAQEPLVSKTDTIQGKEVSADEILKQAEAQKAAQARLKEEEIKMKEAERAQKELAKQQKEADRAIK